MANTPAHLHYTSAHAWLDRSTDPVVVGMTDYAQQQMGELVFIDLPSVGDEVVAGEQAAELESSKAVESFISPVSGTVAAVNSKLENQPELASRDPYGEGWLFKVNSTDADNPEPGLLDAQAYSELEQ